MEIISCKIIIFNKLRGARHFAALPIHVIDYFVNIQKPFPLTFRIPDFPGRQDVFGCQPDTDFHQNVLWLQLVPLYSLRGGKAMYGYPCRIPWKGHSGPDLLQRGSMVPSLEKSPTWRRNNL